MAKSENALLLPAFWDIAKKPLALGWVLTLSAEALVLKKETKSDLAGICFTGKHSGFPYSTAFQKIEEQIFKDNWVLDIARSIKGMKNLYLAPSISSLNHQFTFWPDVENKTY